MDNPGKTLQSKKTLGMSLLYTLPMFLITFMFISGGKPSFSDTTGPWLFLSPFWV